MYGAARKACADRSRSTGQQGSILSVPVWRGDTQEGLMAEVTLEELLLN